MTITALVLLFGAIFVYCGFTNRQVIPALRGEQVSK